MRRDFILRTGLWIVASTVSVCLQAQAPATVPAGKDAPFSQAKGVPVRATPGDYQAQAKAGAVTIAADFMGHAVPTPDGVYNSDDYVVAEVAFFGGPQARLQLTGSDFSLRINGKKGNTASVNAMQVLRSLKDPTWAPPVDPDAKKSSSTSLGSGGNGGEPPPLPPKMPMELQNIMTQRVLKAALLQGERPLPQAGLIFFPYRGKAENIRSLELIYNGAAGLATVNLQP